MQGNFPFNEFLKNSNSNTNTHNELGHSKVNNIEDLANKNIIEDPFNIKQSLNSNPSQDYSSLSDDFFSAEELEMMNCEIHNSLKSLINPQKYASFFQGEFFRLVNIDGERATFSTTTNFIKSFIEKNLEQISQSIVNTLGKSYQIVIITNNNNNLANSSQTSLSQSLNSSGPIEPAQNRPKSANEISFSLDLEPVQEDLLSKVESKYIDHVSDDYNNIVIDKSKTFKNFVIGPSNNMAYAASLAIAKSPGKAGKYPSLYIHSNSGLGKTHLLHAMANGIQNQYPHFVICLITARDFMKEMIESIRNKQLPEFRQKYSEKVDVLMIDDVHELKGKEGTQREFFHIFNELYQKGKQLIFTSDKTPQEINGLEERIKTRLQWGLVVDIQKPDIETRVAIINAKADDLDLFLSEDIVNLIACNVKNSIRELEGALIKLSAYSDIMKVDIELEMVKEVLALRDFEDEKKITIEGIAKQTSQYFKIPVADLKSKSRTKDIANARFVAMYLCRKLANATHEEIGRFFGGRDHSSVVHAEQKISERLSQDPLLSKTIMTIENQL
ncbi:chromosomal replication initiator protein DnaA [Halobacteriovorax vibrionivorans]|uniref:Chromosomal replication initiator protein DnaA n=1 Tax=Halobacteriovorax vibrionivorans TaxID=2152716 RepID=A0ABY0IJA8_9BACT|nr:MULTISPECIES: chromosomal replication initiator protein DnaA [Halobacteriovorax]RZF23054.1 chromosomal replication initiator protein DnaA [Halobacteriovorax vibrionivorans]TGD49315.1 chromosomal replication initiator protein DnaA [Halobacteriovorax sp. Y22]